ncbi:alpha-galactosidase [Lacticaseibacillus paracasei]|nr:alpha-galactosidase [Lacticaseibacillus paracasei]MCT3317322.1 alpha-galactosidase [Lacticaseibacillus paracasei]
METRSQSQKPPCKDLRRNGQSPAITPEATYIPVSKRSCSRFALYHKQRICNCRIGVVDTKVVIDG